MSIEFFKLSEEAGVYSDVVKVDGNKLYLSGLISENLETGEVLSGSMAEETKQVLDNLKVILEKYGSDMDHVVRIQILLSNFEERDEMNAEYIKHFAPEHLPSRVCFGTTGLACASKIEILADAVMK